MGRIEARLGCCMAGRWGRWSTLSARGKGNRPVRMRAPGGERHPRRSDQGHFRSVRKATAVGSRACSSDSRSNRGRRGIPGRGSRSDGGRKTRIDGWAHTPTAVGLRTLRVEGGGLRSSERFPTRGRRFHAFGRRAFPSGSRSDGGGKGRSFVRPRVRTAGGEEFPGGGGAPMRWEGALIRPARAVAAASSALGKSPRLATKIGEAERENSPSVASAWAFPASGGDRARSDRGRSSLKSARSSAWGEGSPCGGVDRRGRLPNSSRP